MIASRRAQYTRAVRSTRASPDEIIIDADARSRARAHIEKIEIHLPLNAVKTQKGVSEDASGITL